VKWFWSVGGRMADPVKTQAKIDRARLRAEVHLESARAKAERKIAKARANLAVVEAKIQSRLKKALRKGNAKLNAGQAVSPDTDDETVTPVVPRGRLPRAPRG